MVNSCLSLLATFFMCTFKLPSTVIAQIDKYRKHLLWRGSDINAKKQPLAAWNMVCRSKNEHGLGITKLTIRNDALLLKYLDKFLNKQDLPWVKLVWNNYYSNGTLPGMRKKGSHQWKRGDKITIHFWSLAF